MSKREITVIEFVSLDGVVQATGAPEEDRSGGFASGGWTVPYFDDFLGKVMGQQVSLERTELLLGQETYEISAGYWPQHADGWPGINKIKKYVVSHDSEFDLSREDSQLLSGDVVQQLRELRNDGGPDLRVWGSSNLARTLLKHDLVDKLWLKIFPVTLGSGKRLFADATIPLAFHLIVCEVSPLGIIVASYERAGEARTGTFG